MVNIYKPKLTNLQQDILRFLFIKAGEPINAHYISKALKVSQPAVSKALPKLEKDELIKIAKDKESKRLAIELNRDHRVIWLKRADNLKQIYESGLVQFFYDNFPSATIILFGSYSTGEDTIKSDVDLAVIGGKDKQADLKDFEKELGRTINLNFYTSFKGLEKHFLDNLLNGILLKGSVEL